MKLKMDYKWVALSVVTVGIFMANLDGSIVVIGLPTILQDLHASIAHGIWIITGYRLIITMLLVMFGRLADLKLAPSTALLMDSKTDPKEITSEIIEHIGMWIVSTSAYDLEGLRWNVYGPIAGSNHEEELVKFISLKPKVPIMVDVPYENQDQEYFDAVALDRILARISGHRQDRNGN